MCHCRLAAVLFLLALTATTDAWAQEMVLGKDGTNLYHRPACPVVLGGQGVLAMTRAQAEGRALKPHDACDPAKMPPEPPPPLPRENPQPRGTPPRSVAPAKVSVETGGRLYHREGCRKLGKDQQRLVLEDAAKRYWPCPVCKPPIRKRKE